jgi:hypothetical protein
MATINLKVSKAKLVSALETKLEQIRANKTNEKKALQAYDKAVEAWRKKVVASIPKTRKPDEVSVCTLAYGSFAGKTKVEITYYLDNAPERPENDVEVLADYAYREAVSEIESAIRILALSDDEVVSTSTYKSVAKYL